MAKVRDYHKLALDIIDVVGGQKNIVNATRCATRLRLVLKETPEGVKEKVSALAGVITVVENNGQFQVVIGTHVGEVYDSVAEALHLDASAQEIEQPKQNIVNRIIATMSAVFAPFVYILAAAGLLQGALILITMAAPSFAETGTYEVLNFMSWTPFTFLPIFIAITASKHFKCNTYIAILCCCALVNQSWADIAARIADGDVVRFLGVKLSGDNLYIYRTSTTASGMGTFLSGAFYRKETSGCSQAAFDTTDLFCGHGSGNDHGNRTCICDYSKCNCEWLQCISSFCTGTGRSDHRWIMAGSRYLWRALGNYTGRTCQLRYEWL